jgi:FkbM family methyltransferase
MSYIKYSKFGLKETLKLTLGNFLLNYSNQQPARYNQVRKYTVLDTLMRKANDFNRCTIINVEGDEDIGDFSVLLRHNTSDFRVFNQVMLDKEYKALADYVNKYIPSYSVKYIIDAGGNIGLTTLYLKKRFHRAHIVSIEPDGKNLSALQKNVRLNRLTNVSWLKAGLWGKGEELTIDRSFRDGREWSIALTSANNIAATATLKGMTVENIMHKFSFPYIDILKIDIEGAERFVFADDYHVSSFLSKVRLLQLKFMMNIISESKYCGNYRRIILNIIIMVNLPLA